MEKVEKESEGEGKREDREKVSRKEARLPLIKDALLDYSESCDLWECDGYITRSLSDVIGESLRALETASHPVPDSLLPIYLPLSSKECAPRMHTLEDGPGIRQSRSTSICSVLGGALSWNHCPYKTSLVCVPNYLCTRVHDRSGVGGWS